MFYYQCYNTSLLFQFSGCFLVIVLQLFTNFLPISRSFLANFLLLSLCIWKIYQPDSFTNKTKHFQTDRRRVNDWKTELTWLCCAWCSLGAAVGSVRLYWGQLPLSCFPLKPPAVKAHELSSHHLFITVGLAHLPLWPILILKTVRKHWRTVISGLGTCGTGGQ